MGEGVVDLRKTWMLGLQWSHVCKENDCFVCKGKGMSQCLKN